MKQLRKPMRRYDRSDVDAAIEMADEMSVAEIEELVRKFCLYDRIFDSCLALIMGLTLWISRARQAMVELPLWNGEYLSVPLTLVMLFCVYLILIVRHGRINLGMTLAIAHGIASERARRAAAEKTSPTNASK